MGTKTPVIIRCDVVTEIKRRLAEINDPTKLRYLYNLTPWGSEIQQIITDKWEEVAKPIALAETSKCATEEEARALYKKASRPHKGEADAIYLECWKKFANEEAQIKAASCKTYEEALVLYESAPNGFKAKGIYHELLRKFEERLRHKWLQECKTAKDVDDLKKRLKTHDHDFAKRCENLKTSFEEVEERQKLLLCKTPEEVLVLFKSNQRTGTNLDLMLFLLEKLALEELEEKITKCKDPYEAKQLMQKYAMIPSVSKVYKKLYLDLLEQEARDFVKTLTGENQIRQVYDKYNNSPKDSEARKIYFDKYCELIDEEDKHLKPFGQDISVKDFSGWYTEVACGEHSDYQNARRLETIFMNQLLEQGLI